jgi:fructoselysine 6-kinase
LEPFVKHEVSKMIRIVAVGDNVVDCYSAPNMMYPGGNCLNLSIFARRFGAETAYVGAIGRDKAGQAISAALAKENVRTDRLRVLPGRTAHCVIGHREGERIFLSADLGVSMFEPAEEDFTYVKSFDAAHIGQSSGLDSHISRFAANTRLSYDFSYKHAHPRFEAIASRCFLASFSGGDLSEADATTLIRQATGAGARWALVTRGRQGAIFGGVSGIFKVAARPCDVVDTLGAGDTFIARVLAGLLHGDEPPSAFLDAASAAAAETCTYFGATGHGVPLALEVEAAGRAN